MWPSYYPVTIFVNKPVDLGNVSTAARVHQMVADFEAMDKCKGESMSRSVFFIEANLRL